MMMLPTTVTAAPSPSTPVEQRNHDAAAAIWARVEFWFDDQIEYWATRRAACDDLFLVAELAREEGGSIEDEGCALFVELFCDDRLEVYTMRELGEGLRILRRALETGEFPIWLSAASGLYPLN